MSTDERETFKLLVTGIAERLTRDELLPLTCLVCRGELVNWESWRLCPDCRYYYPHEMIAAADPIEWHAIQLGKLACQRCPQVLPNVPRVHIDDEGLPMPCPVPPPKLSAPMRVRRYSRLERWLRRWYGAWQDARQDMKDYR